MRQTTTIVRTPFSNVAKRSALHTRGRMKGMGIGNVLLDGGLGGQSSYSSVNDFVETTNWKPSSRTKAIGGMGLSNKIGKVLGELNIQKPLDRKKKNIKFSL
jgi:hypothetical protein